MPPDRPSPHEHARAMAKKVARLFSRNRDYFLENVETFKREDVEWQRKVRDAGKTVDEAFRAILDEREAIKAGKATPRLTDKKKRPEPGFEWRDNFHCPGETDEDDAPDGQMAEGWISQEAVRALAIQYEAANDRGIYWPGQNPTPATMVTLLAALHDECLPNSPTILDPASGRPLTVAQGTDRGLWALYTARLWCIGAVKGNTDRLDALETYLYHVKEHLAEVQAMKPETAPPPAKTLEERARDIALTVDGLFRHNGHNDTWFREQWDTAVRESDQWDESAEEEKHAKANLTPTDRAVEELYAEQDAKLDDWTVTDTMWPGPNPSIAARALSLAVLRDVVTDGPKILPPMLRVSGAVKHIRARNFDDGALRRVTDRGAGRPPKMEVRVGDILRRRGWRFNAKGMKRLEGYLEDVLAYLSKQSGRGVGAGKDEGEAGGARAGASKEEAATGPRPKGKALSHFLTVRFPGKQRNEYGAPAAFFKVADPAAGRVLLTLFGEDYGAVAPKGPGLVFDLVATEGLSPAQAVRFNSIVRQVKETWEQAWSVTDGPDFSAGRAGDLARLYDRAEKWQAEMPEGEQAAPIPKAAPASDAGQVGGGEMRAESKVAPDVLKRLHELHGAWQRLCETVRAGPSFSTAHEVAAIRALDLHAANLGLLNQCRQEYGMAPDVGDVFSKIEEWATLGPANKVKSWDYFASYMEGDAVHEGGSSDRHSWGEQLQYWIGKCLEAAAKTPEDGAASASTWQDVQRRLLELVEKGERFTSYGELAVRLKCAKNTVRKAVGKSGKLRAWKDPEAKKSPRAQSLNVVVRDSARSNEPDPADMVLPDEVDTTMRRLIEQAETPEKRAALNELDGNGRRELVRLTLEQDSDRRLEEEAPRGNKILGRKP